MPRMYPEEDPTISDTFKMVIAANTMEIASVYAILGKMEKMGKELRYGPDPQKTSKDTSSITIPDIPPGVNIDFNIRRAMRSDNIIWFLDRLMPHGEMDYKYTKGKEYEDFGNFNFGAVAAAYGFSEEIALRAAGLVQYFANIYYILNDNKISKEQRHDKVKMYSHDHYNDFLGPSPYGDQEKDQEMIKQGYRYYKENFLPNYTTSERGYDFIHLYMQLFNEKNRKPYQHALQRPLGFKVYQQQDERLIFQSVKQPLFLYTNYY